MPDISSLFFPADIKSRMITALRDCQDRQGYWCFPPQRTDIPFSSVWTTAQTLWALLIFGEKPNYYAEALNTIKTTDILKEKDIVVGWHHENIPDNYGICVTSDCIIALILCNDINFVRDPIEKLVDLQVAKNGDVEGWGFLDTDDASRVTPTCWALRALMYASGQKDLSNPNIISSIKHGINWLLNAQSRYGGWGERFGSSARVSCTAWAIITILESLKYSEIKLNRNIINTAIVRGIKKIKELYSQDLKCWVGTPESFSKLRKEGLGSSIVLIALLKSALSGLLSPDDEYIFFALNELKSEYEGWIRPVYRETKIFDNVYWLLALSQFQDFWLEKSFLVFKDVKRLKSKIRQLNSTVHKLLLIPLFSLVGLVVYLLTWFWPKEVLRTFWTVLISAVGGTIAMIIWRWPLRSFFDKKTKTP